MGNPERLLDANRYRPSPMACVKTGSSVIRLVVAESMTEDFRVQSDWKIVSVLPAELISTSKVVWMLSAPSSREIADEVFKDNSPL